MILIHWYNLDLITWSKRKRMGLGNNSETHLK
nr:MAG TPA: hypothetical protein [Caudoviricetes sp.]